MPFLAADCQFDMGDYDTARRPYQVLAERYPDRLEGLNALGGMVRCYSALGDTANDAATPGRDRRAAAEDAQTGARSVVGLAHDGAKADQHAVRRIHHRVTENTEDKIEAIAFLCVLCVLCDSVVNPSL